MKYERLKIDVLDMDDVLGEILELLSEWQQLHPDKVITLSTDDIGRTVYKVLDVPDGPIEIDL